SLAYASTVHKVQGSEFDAIVLLLHPSHYLLLDRAMLYTALTRAKRLAVILSDRQSLEMAARNARAREVNDRLPLRMMEAPDPAATHERPR
ncbi:MAG: ATP-binding domain-containing protein, partial [Sandaracinaceae bacterium]|nr:ATP-binding domain-containing protein [Sandaracinaceae bacterium]